MLVLIAHKVAGSLHDGMFVDIVARQCKNALPDNLSLCLSVLNLP